MERIQEIKKGMQKDSYEMGTSAFEDSREAARFNILQEEKMLK